MLGTWAKLFAIVACVAGTWWPYSLLAATCPKPWPMWSQFVKKHIEPDGRVVDLSVPEQITTSEGQSYAMFFALVQNDQAQFDRLLQWTERYLTFGGLEYALPAWKWGKTAIGTYGLLDANSATDSDLWIAYNLLEAGRLWKRPELTAKGKKLLDLIRVNASHNVPDFGDVLLPGPQGFVLDEGRAVRLNPSYFPPFLMQALAHHSGQAFWRQQVDTSARLVLAASSQGYVPDWFVLREGQPGPDPQNGPYGSYDAIRTYLWVQMTAPSDRHRAALLGAIRAYPVLANRLGEPLERVDVRSGVWYGQASPVFFYAIAPSAKALKLKQLQAATDARLAADRANNFSQLAYYDWVVGMFATGYEEGRFRFDGNGTLQTRWKKPC